MALRLSREAYQRLLKGQLAAKGNKYHARKTVADGRTFDSAFEARCYQDLVMRERIGEVRELRVQVEYPLVVEGHHVCSYVADFVFEERVDGAWEPRITDAKSEPTRRTRAYRIKKKLMAALGHPIVELMNTHNRRTK